MTAAAESVLETETVPLAQYSSIFTDGVRIGIVISVRADVWVVIIATAATTLTRVSSGEQSLKIALRQNLAQYLGNIPAGSAALTE